MGPPEVDHPQLNTCCAANATGTGNVTFILQVTWVSVLKGTLLSLIAFGAIFGNSLVILSVYINRKLRTITNCFVVSLATSDLLVAILVLPLGIKLELTGVWGLGTVVCDMWISCDVMLCTASILNLCCISLDRFFAITNPLIYATKRSKRLALLMIGLVWVASAVITCPPIFGWQEEGRGQDDVSCELTKDPGYVIYSSLGSFYIPLFVMMFVYARIFQVTIQRDKLLRPYCTTYVFDKSRGFRRWKRETFSSSTPRDTGRPPSPPVAVATDPVPRNPRDPEREESEEEEEEGYLGPEPVSRDPSVQRSYILMQKVHSGQVVSATVKTNELALTREANHKKHGSNGHHSVLGALGNGTTSGCVEERHVPEITQCQEEKDYVLTRDEKRRERAVLQRESKTAKTLAIVVGCFVVCWLPFFVMYVLEPFCTHCNIDPAMKTVFTWLGYCNSVLNPFIYAFYNKDFRYSFWKLTCGLVSRRN